MVTSEHVQLIRLVWNWAGDNEWNWICVWVSTCKNYCLSALFVESWGQTHIHNPPHLHLHLDCLHSPPSHIQFCFQMVASRAKRNNKYIKTTYYLTKSP